MTLSELDARGADVASSGWLRVTVVDDHPIPDLARKVRQHLGNALVVRFEPRVEARGEGRVACVYGSSSSSPLASRPSPLQMYREFHQRRYERPADAAVEEAFQHLYEQCED